MSQKHSSLFVVCLQLYCTEWETIELWRYLGHLMAGIPSPQKMKRCTFSVFVHLWVLDAYMLLTHQASLIKNNSLNFCLRLHEKQCDHYG